MPFVLLANIAPSLQHHVLDQMQPPKFVVADTMDLWLNIALQTCLPCSTRRWLCPQRKRGSSIDRHGTTSSAPRAQFTNFGPKYVIIKKGEHGSILSGPNGFSSPRRSRLQNVIDPTGAGDSFVGGMMGYIATAKARSKPICGAR